MARTSRDFFRLHLAVAGFGFAGVFGKLTGLGSAALTAGRAAFAALAIALVLVLAGRAGELLPRRRERAGLLLGLLLAVHWWTFFRAVQTATVGVALVSFSVAPVLLLGLEALGRRQWPGARPAWASLLALAGVLVLAPSLRWSDATVRGMAWGVASGGTYALLALLNRPLVRTDSPWRLTLWQNGVAALVLAPALAGAHPTPRDWGLLVLLGVVFTAGTHGLFLRSMRTLSAHLAVLTATLEPAYGLVAAAVLLGERPAPRTLLGAAMIGAAVLAASLARSAPDLENPQQGHDGREQ